MDTMYQVLAGEEMALTGAEYPNLRNGIWDAEKYPIHASQWDKVDDLYIDLGSAG